MYWLLSRFTILIQKIRWIIQKNTHFSNLISYKTRNTFDNVVFSFKMISILKKIYIIIAYTAIKYIPRYIRMRKERVKLFIWLSFDLFRIISPNSGESSRNNNPSKFGEIIYWSKILSHFRDRSFAKESFISKTYPLLCGR